MRVDIEFYSLVSIQLSLLIFSKVDLTTAY